MPLRLNRTLRVNSQDVRNQERCPGPMCGELYQPGEVISVADCTHTMHKVCRVQMQFQFSQTNQDTPCIEHGCMEFWGFLNIMERPTRDCHKAANATINTIITQRIVAAAAAAPPPPPPPVVQPPPPPPIVMQPPPMPMVHPPPHQNQGAMVPIGGPGVDINNNLATLLRQIMDGNQRRDGGNGNGNAGGSGGLKVNTNNFYL